jgi:adenylate cyclase class IV
MIEVEKIAVFDLATYKRLLTDLPKHGAKDLGDNHTENIFYIHDNYQLKVSKALSKNKAKIALKIKKLGAASSQEIELNFDLREASSAEKIIDSILPYTTKIPTTQTRRDYRLNEINIALKHSKDWGYHAEFEKVVTKPQDALRALAEIEKAASSLGLKVLSEKKEKDHILEKLNEYNQKS